MKRLVVLAVAVGVLSGCESMNEMMVRQIYIDRHLSSDLHGRISEGYRRRMEQPAATSPHVPAPEFLDQG